jgi:RNA polymerase sigma-70 factor (ECF subfamily)
VRKSTPASLLQACRRGDERAARLLHAQTAPALYACAQAILRDAALAEDAVQQAFCRVMSIPLREIDRVVDPVPWLTMLARREALMTLRAARRRIGREQRSSKPRPDQSGASEPPAGDESVDADVVHLAIQSLPRRLGEVITLKHVCGLTFDQIAVALSANRNTVASRYRIALERLRTSLASGSHAPGPQTGQEVQPCPIR